MTNLLYMEEHELTTTTATVISTQKDDVTQRASIILDKTIFYPQGGGQPADQGIIENAHGRFTVNDVRLIDGIVHHYGSWESGSFDAGETVKLTIDTNRRWINSLNHSAGHLIDTAVNNLGKKFTPGKGYHFPDSPYVEYRGDLPAEERELFQQDLQKAVNQLIAQKQPITARFAQRDELPKICDFVPDYLPENKPIRVVTIGQSSGCPCGGTHVGTTGDLAGLTIERIKVKGDSIKISYKIK